jgi:RNA-binding protein YlmH
MNTDDKLLISKIEDKARQCSENSMITNSDFLDMHQKSVVASMRLPYPDVRMVFYGGFDGAERTVAVFLPDYIEDELSDHFSAVPEDDPLTVIELTKDKFSPALSHRDYLGALMGLGIRREMTGDIIVSENGCRMAVLSKMAPFILDNLGKAGRGTLKGRILETSEAREGTKATGIPESFTVSSMRLDSVVKNAFSVSRGDAAEAIEGGVVFVNDIECTKPDRKIVSGDKIVFRRKGRIIVGDCSGVSKKGRVIVNIIKFI